MDVRPSADEALEDALYDGQALERFARMDLSAVGVPDATTLLNFRHLLETRWSETSTGRLRANAALSGRWLMAQNEALQAVEKANASVRAFVVKSIFRYRKVRYRGLAKNGQQLYTLFGLANVLIGARARATA